MTLLAEQDSFSARRLADDAHAPLLRAPEKVRSVYLVTAIVASLPLLAGVVLFGWRAAIVAIVAIGSCAAIEKLYFLVSHAPAMLGRTHAYLTGVLLALTLPPTTPWYVVVMASAFAIIIGKAVFGGVGHFLWQPALVGRFAVAVIVPSLVQLAGPDFIEPISWPDLDSHRAGPVLARGHLVSGNARNVKSVEHYDGWRRTDAPPGADGFLLPHPAAVLGGLSRTDEPQFSSLAEVREKLPTREPTLVSELPPLEDLLIGTRPGGIGETAAVVLIVAGLYLVYRNYVKWQLPLAFLFGAAVVAAVAPVEVLGPNHTTETLAWPIVAEGLDVGFTYVNYQVLSGAMLLAAFFLAPEMTTSPVTPGGQMLFGLGCGATAMLLKLYFDSPIPAYLAVLGWNTLVPTIDTLWRPRVFGQKHFSILRRR